MATVLTELNLPGSDSGIDMVNPFIQFWGEFTSELPGLDRSLPMIGAAVLVLLICYILASKFVSSMKRIGAKGFAAGTTLSALVGFPMQVGVLLLAVLQMVIFALISVVGGFVNVISG